jgi:hypothetical protein
LDDGTSIIPIFEARQTGLVIHHDQVEPVISIAQQAQRNKKNQRMEFAAELSSRKVHLADTDKKAQSQPKAKKKKKSEE